MVVVDTNILVSAFQFGGNPARLVDMVRSGKLEVAIAPSILDEFERILLDSKTSKRLRFAGGVTMFDVGGVPGSYSYKAGSSATNSVSLSVPIPTKPLTPGASFAGGSLKALNVGYAAKKFLRVQVYADIGTVGDSNCK